MLLLNKNINFNKNETESKMENPTHTFKEMNLLEPLFSLVRTEFTFGIFNVPKSVYKSLFWSVFNF